MDSIRFTLALVPLVSKCYRGDKVPSGFCTRLGFVSHLKNSEPKKPQNFIIDSNQNCSAIIQKGDIILLYWTLNRPSLCSRGRHYLYILSIFAMQMTLKRQAGRKRQCLCTMICKKARDPQEKKKCLLKCSLDDYVNWYKYGEHLAIKTLQ